MRDTSWKLRDKTGKVFDLWRYEFKDQTKQSCLSDRKTDITSKAFRVGSTENYIQLIKITNYPLKRIVQPSL